MASLVTCFIISDDSRYTSLIKIARTDSVYTLKKAINEKEKFERIEGVEFSHLLLRSLVSDFQKLNITTQS